MLYSSKILTIKNKKIKNLKIGLYVPVLQEKSAGIGIFVDSLLLALKDKEVEIIVFTEKKIKNKYLSFDKSKLKFFEIIPGKLTKFPRILKKIYRLFWINLFLSKILKKEKIKEFISITFEAPLPIYKDVKYGIIIHDFTALYYSGWAFLLERIYLNIYLKFCLSKFNYIFVPSKSTALIVNKKYPNICINKFNIISEGFDKKAFYLPTEKEKLLVKNLYNLPSQYFLYSGTLLEHKNLIILLKAMQIIKKYYPNCQLLIIGPSSKREIINMKKSINFLSLDNNVRLVGYVPRNHLRSLMHCSNAFLFPSKSEGFGLSVLEAMASGSYIISSDSTSLPEVLGSAGELIPPDDLKLWVKYMKKSLELRFISIKSKEKRLKAIKRANLFSWDITADNILNKIYEG